MRWTILLLLLCCLPLSAGGTDVLTDAVRDFASDDPGVRRSASRAVRTLLEQNLAPLLKAMSSPDPEVARRAREAVVGLLPASSRSGQQVVPGGNWIQLGPNAGVRPVRMWMRQNGVVIVGGNHNQQAAKDLRKFGLQGYPCSQTFVRHQLGLAEGRGFVVSQVKAGSAAARIGLATHDIILAVDGKPTMQANTFARLIGATEDWLLRRVRVMRAGKVVEVGGPGKVR